MSDNAIEHIKKLIDGSFLDIMPTFYNEGAELEAILAIKSLMQAGKFTDALQLAKQKSENDIFKQNPTPLEIWYSIALWKVDELSYQDLKGRIESKVVDFPNLAFIPVCIAILHGTDDEFHLALDSLESSHNSTKLNPLEAAVGAMIRDVVKGKDSSLQGVKQSFKNIPPLNASPKQFVSNLECFINNVERSKEIHAHVQNTDCQKIDWERLALKNQNFFAMLPSIKYVKHPSLPKTIFVSADTHYLREYVTTLIFSALELSDRDFGIHIHLYHPSYEDLRFIQSYDKIYPELNLSYSYEDKPVQIKGDIILYYTCMRFCHAYKVFHNYDVLKKMVILDADAILRQNPFKNQTIQNSQVTVTCVGENNIGESKGSVLGWLTAFEKTENGSKAFAYFIHALFKSLADRNEDEITRNFDECAIYEMFKVFEKESGVSFLSALEVAGGFDFVLNPHLEQSETCLIWTHMGNKKNQDGPMNRERSRLKAKYQIFTSHASLDDNKNHQHQNFLINSKSQAYKSPVYSMSISS